MHLSGEPFLDAEITLDRDDAHFVVTLLERNPDFVERYLAPFRTLTWLPLGTARGVTGAPQIAKARKALPLAIRLLPLDSG